MFDLTYIILLTNAHQGACGALPQSGLIAGTTLNQNIFSINSKFIIRLLMLIKELVAPCPNLV